MTRLNVTDARCEALFASGLQRSDAPDAEMVAEVISHAVRQLGTRGCAGRMAQEFGDHPEIAADRMRWVRQLVGEVSARPSRGGRAGAGGRRLILAASRAGQPPAAPGAPPNRGIGNNGPVSTARASSFLNCPGGAVARWWSLAWPERVASVAGPLVNLAAPVSLGLPGVPGPRLTVRHLKD